MALPAFDVAPLTQITFIADNQVVPCLLRDIASVTAAPELQVNLRGYLQLQHHCRTLIKLVPGIAADVPFPGTNDGVARVVDVLRRYCIKYSLETVLLVNIQPIPGQLARITSVLTAGGVSVEASYLDEGQGSIFEVSDLQLATRLLTLPLVDQDRLIAQGLHCGHDCHCH